MKKLGVTDSTMFVTEAQLVLNCCYLPAVASVSKLSIAASARLPGMPQARNYIVYSPLVGSWSSRKMLHSNILREIQPPTNGGYTIVVILLELTLQATHGHDHRPCYPPGVSTSTHQGVAAWAFDHCILGIYDCGLTISFIYQFPYMWLFHGGIDKIFNWPDCIPH